MWSSLSAAAGAAAAYIPGASYLGLLPEPAAPPSRLLVLDTQTERASAIAGAVPATTRLVLYDSAVDSLAALAARIRAAQVPGGFERVTLHNPGADERGAWRWSADACIAVGDVAGRKRAAQLRRAVDSAARQLGPVTAELAAALAPGAAGAATTPHVVLHSCREAGGYDIEAALPAGLWRVHDADFRGCAVPAAPRATAVPPASPPLVAADGIDLRRFEALSLSLSAAGAAAAASAVLPSAAAEQPAVLPPDVAEQLVVEDQQLARGASRRANRLRAAAKRSSRAPLVARRPMSRRQMARMWGTARPEPRAGTPGVARTADKAAAASRVHSKRQRAASG